jgi:hypothetical protein
MDVDIKLKDVVFVLLISVTVFFIFSFLIMYTYNNSIVKMNSNWKSITYETSIMFTLFLMVTATFMNRSKLR